MKEVDLSPEILKNIEHDYYAGALTQEQIAKKYAEFGLNKRNLSRLAKSNCWTDLRVQSAQTVQKKVSEKVKEVVEAVIVENEVDVADFLISEFHLNKNHYELYEGVAEVMKDMVKSKTQVIKRNNGNTYTIPLTLDDYKTIVDIVTKIQGGQRLSVGLKDKKDPKEKGNQFNINMFGNLQSEIREQVIKGASMSLLDIQKMVEDNLSE